MLGRKLLVASGMGSQESIAGIERKVGQTNRQTPLQCNRTTSPDLVYIRLMSILSLCSMGRRHYTEHWPRSILLLQGFEVGLLFLRAIRQRIFRSERRSAPVSLFGKWPASGQAVPRQLRRGESSTIEIFFVLFFNVTKTYESRKLALQGCDFGRAFYKQGV